MVSLLSFCTRTRITAVAVLAACTLARVCVAGDALPGTVSGASFGRTPGGTAAELYTLRNRHGMEARISTYGGIVTFLTAPDRAGHFADVVLGYDSLDQYVQRNPYFGALIGRYANRIAHGQFDLDGVHYTLATNNGGNSLHGGNIGFDKVVWTVAKANVGRMVPR
jgi:aldose 1-epimerase